jgi:hypothetical protein
MLNQEKRTTTLTDDRSDPIVVEGSTILITRRISLEAEMAATVMSAAQPEMRPEVMRRLLESGAEAESVYRANVALQLFERRFQGMQEGFGKELNAILETGGNSVETRVVRALHKHERDLIEWTVKFTDAGSETGLPNVVARQLRKVTDVAIAQLNVLLADGDTSALGRWSEKISKQIQESERNILNQVIHKQAIASVGVGRGRTYEEALSAKLGKLAAAMGYQVERCSDRLGIKKTKHGDHLITIDSTAAAGTSLRVVVEEKSRADGQRFSYAGVQRECGQSRSNREAGAAMFVAESRECLPDGVAFGQVGKADFFVEYDPATDDDLGLAAALYLAREAALRDLKPAGPGPVDRLAARRQVAEIRDRIERRNRIRAYHSSAAKAITNAAKALDEDADAILGHLAKLDGLFQL